MRLLILTSLLLFATTTVRSAETVDYVGDVVPILHKYCVACHTDGDENGGLNLDSHEALMRGGESGIAITAGEPGSSRLVLMASGQLEPVMPPDGEPGPNEEELAVLNAWIEQGAMGPDGDMPVRQQLRTPDITPSDNVESPITSIELSRDGILQAIARFGKVEIRRADDSLATTIDDQPGKVNSLQFNTDTTRLLIATGVTGAYGRAAIYSVADGKLITEMVGHRDTLYAAVFSPDQTKVATAGYDQEIVLWDAASGEPLRRFSGHNGAIFDLAFSPDGKVLASACADETVKIWKVDDGQRLDTLSQPEGEVFAVDITADGKFVLAGSADNRLRVWRLRSTEKRRINPIVATRFVDETSLVDFQLTPDGKSLVVLSQGGNVKLVRTSDWNQYATLEPLADLGSDLSISPDGSSVMISLMNGELVRRDLPPPSSERHLASESLGPVYMDLGPLQELDEATLRDQQQGEPSVAELLNDASSAVGTPLRVGRGVSVTGVISEPGKADHYLWSASAGEVWALDADVAGANPLDPAIAILDVSGRPVLRTRLQAVRDSYFTFRGKDSNQVGDFRLFNWQEMRLSEFLFAAGEVTRLWMHPRGPDSGFNVYPGEGNRWTYFGTTHTTHALGEPAYIVRPLERGEPAVANGLPVFDIYYENDDDPSRRVGKNSRLLFTAPADGHYLVRVTDTTGGGGDTYKYKLSIRAADPDFKPMVQAANGTLRRGTGREFVVRADRIDGFEGPISFELSDLPPGLTSNAPITIEAGQRYAVGTIWADSEAPAWEGKISAELIATAMINGRRVERRAGIAGEFTLGDRPSVVASIQPINGSVPTNEDWTLQIPRGETVSARVVIDRKEGFKSEVSFGKENSGRNASQGVYVDNIGLNGLLVLAGMNEREFFVTADPTATPGKRSFFLTANVDGGVTTYPITVEVLP